MRTSNFRFSRVRWELAVALVVMLLCSISIQSAEVIAAPTAQTTPNASGIVCTNGASPNPSFTLTAKSGYADTPDGNTIFMWGYALGNNGFQLPGPVLCVHSGDTVSIVLNNTLGEDVSMIFPGQDNVRANGVPAQPQLNGTDVTSLTNVAPKNGGSITYSFVAGQPGTYYYESGTDMGKQVPMGLFGALIVRPSGHDDWAYNDSGTQFNPAAEYVMILSEVDPFLHQAIERGQSYDVTANHPRYWMINGRSFPDTIADNNAAWLPHQPYGSLVHIQPYNSSSNPYPALVRYINVGSLNHPFHPHGNHGRVIARDGNLLKGPSNEDLSYEKFLVLVGSSQTWDVTYKWTDVELWKPNTNPIPVTIPSQQNLTFKDSATWYSGSPYLGVQDELPVGVTSYNQCGEFYHVWHSHALNEAANYDTGFGGMFTLQRIDPPGGCH